MDARYATLVADTVTTITLDGDYRTVEVMSVDGAAAVYFTVDSTTNPTVGGSGCWSLPSAASAREIESRASGATVVKLISSGTPTIGVLGVG